MKQSSVSESVANVLSYTCDSEYGSGKKKIIENVINIDDLSFLKQNLYFYLKKCTENNRLCLQNSLSLAAINNSLFISRILLIFLS